MMQVCSIDAKPFAGAVREAAGPSIVDGDDAARLRRLAERVRDTGYLFTTVTPRSHAVVNDRPGNAVARDLRDVFGWSRPFAEGLLAPDLLALMDEAGVLERRGPHCRSRVRFSSFRGELYMHSAFPTTASDAVFFGPDTHKFLDAISTHLAARDALPARAVDVCTGAGPGAITIAKASPAADVSMVDVNPVALSYASVNAAVAGCANARPCLSDKLAGLEGFFDLIVAHPPYLVDQGSRGYRHGGGALGADLSLAVVRDSLDRLAPGGTLLLFTGVAMVDGRDPFKAVVAPWMAEAGSDWTYREVDPDVFGDELGCPAYGAVDRIALIVLEARRGAGAA